MTKYPKSEDLAEEIPDVGWNGSTGFVRLEDILKNHCPTGWPDQTWDDIFEINSKTPVVEELVQEFKKNGKFDYPVVLFPCSLDVDDDYVDGYKWYPAGVQDGYHRLTAAKLMNLDKVFVKFREEEDNGCEFEDFHEDLCIFLKIEDENNLGFEPFPDWDYFSVLHEVLSFRTSSGVWISPCFGSGDAEVSRIYFEGFENRFTSSETFMKECKDRLNRFRIKNVEIVGAAWLSDIFDAASISENDDCSQYTEIVYDSCGECSFYKPFVFASSFNYVELIREARRFDSRASGMFCGTSR